MNAPKQKQVNWIDLSAYNARLIPMRFPDGRIRIILQGLQQGGQDWNWAIAALGFSTARSGTFLYREGGKIDLGPFGKRFPKAKSINKPINEIMQFSTAPGATTKKIEVDARSKNILGMNHLGQMVCEGATGRYIQTDGGTIALSESESKNPALFLRAVTDSDLALCADGFVERMVRGEMMHSEDLRRFGSVVFGEEKPLPASDLRLRQVQEAVEAGMQRRLEKEMIGPSAEAFELAVMLTERQPNFIYRTSSSVANQQYSTPLPMSVVAQRILDVLPGMSILEPTIGNGSLVSALPLGISIVGCEIDPRRAAQASRLRDDLEIRTGDFTKIGLGREFDAVIANPPFGGLQNPQEIEGLRVTRIDHLILMRSLLARKPEGRSVYIIGADRHNLVAEKAGEIEGGSKYLFNWLADHYELEGVAEIDGRLYEKQGAGYPVRMVVVGPRRSDAEIEKQKKAGEYRMKGKLPVIRSWEALWEYSDVALQLHREKVVLRDEELAAQGVVVQDEEQGVNDAARAGGQAVVSEEVSNLQANHYQAPYVSASKLGESTSMVPRNLVAPISQAFEDFENEFGSVDEFVARSLQYDIDELGSYFSPEQVDAIALGIAATNRGRSLINGDVTGFGKGRVASAMMRYALLRGENVVFMTEKPNLFSDIWRDMEDIGSLDLIRPLMVNDGVEIRGQDNKRAVAPSRKKDVDRLINEGIHPSVEGYNTVFITYSQINKRMESSKKSHWFVNVVADGAVMVMDESHNAAGESNMGENVSEAMLSASWAVYSSATYAKNAKNMGVYYKAFPAGVCDGNLAETLQVGGEPLQEILSGMLARDGVFVRREHDLSKLTFVTQLDVAHKERNEDFADKMSEILLAMSYFSGDVDVLVTKLQKDVRKNLEKLSDEQRAGARMNVTRANFGSRLYTIMRQSQMSMLVDQAADSAIAALENGRKPVIVLEQTQEQLVRDVIAAYSGEDFDEEGEISVASLVNKSVDIPMITMRDVLRRTLNKLDQITERNGYGVVTKVSAIEKSEDEEQAKAWVEAKDRIHHMIDDLPDMPCSPIDVIRYRIEQAGYSCGELTGRSIQLSINDASNGMVAMNRVDDRLATIYGFNNGQIDALVLSGAGATGISLHSSEKFEDQRQREMIELQIANNVAARLQFFGRCNRRGQVIPPMIRSLTAGLPGEARTLAMQNAKLRRLSANTQSDRENAAESKNVIDVINPVGDKICLRFLENNPDIARMLDIDIENEDGTRTGAEDDAFFANKLFGRIGLLRIADQRRILDEISREYETTLADLERIGVNPFRSSEYDWKAKVVDRKIFMGTEQERYDSVFDEPVFLTTLEWEEERNPLRGDRVAEAIDRHSQNMLLDARCKPGNSAAFPVDVSPVLDIARDLYLGDEGEGGIVMKKHWAPDLEKRFGSMRNAFLAKDVKDDNPLKRAFSRWAFLRDTLDWLKVGGRFQYRDETGQAVKGKVVGITLPESGREHLLGQYVVHFAVPGEQQFSHITLSRLFELGIETTLTLDPLLSWSPKSDDFFFDDAPSGMVTLRRPVLDGNLFKAAQVAAERNLGMAGIYTDEHGQRNRAIVTWWGVTEAELMSVPVKIDRADVAVAMFKKYPNISFYTESNSDRKGALKIMADSNRIEIVANGAKTHGGKWFLDEGLIAMIGEFAGGRDFMRAVCPAERLPEIVEYLYRKGNAFYAGASRRDEVMALTTQLVEAEKRARETARQVTENAKASTQTNVKV